MKQQKKGGFLTMLDTLADSLYIDIADSGYNSS